MMLNSAITESFQVMDLFYQREVILWTKDLFNHWLYLTCSKSKQSYIVCVIFGILISRICAGLSPYFFLFMARLFAISLRSRMSPVLMM